MSDDHGHCFRVLVEVRCFNPNLADWEEPAEALSAGEHAYTNVLTIADSADEALQNARTLLSQSGFAMQRVESVSDVTTLPNRSDTPAELADVIRQVLSSGAPALLAFHTWGDEEADEDDGEFYEDDDEPEDFLRGEQGSDDDEPSGSDEPPLV